MNEAVTLDIENGIADLRLNPPDKMNAVDEKIMTGLGEESDCSRQLMGTANQLEAVMSTFEQRDPRFTSPE